MFSEVSSVMVPCVQPPQNSEDIRTDEKFGENNNTKNCADINIDKKASLTSSDVKKSSTDKDKTIRDDNDTRSYVVESTLTDIKVSSSDVEVTLSDAKTSVVDNNKPSLVEVKNTFQEIKNKLVASTILSSFKADAGEFIPKFNSSKILDGNSNVMKFSENSECSQNEHLDISSINFQPVVTVTTTTASSSYNSTIYTTATNTSHFNCSFEGPHNNNNNYNNNNNSNNNNNFYCNGFRKGYHRYLRSRRCNSRSPHRFAGLYNNSNNNNNINSINTNNHNTNNINISNNNWISDYYDYYCQENSENEYYYSGYSPNDISSDISENCYGSGYECEPLNTKSYNTHSSSNGYGFQCHSNLEGANSNILNSKNGYHNFNKYQIGYHSNSYGRGRFKQGREDWLPHHFGPNNPNSYYSNGYYKPVNHCPSHNSMQGTSGGSYRGSSINRGRGRLYNGGLSPRTAKNNARNSHNYRYKTPPLSPIPHKWENESHPPLPSYYYRDEPMNTTLTVDVGSGLGTLEEYTTMNSFCEFGMGGGGLLDLEGCKVEESECERIDKECDLKESCSHHVKERDLDAKEGGHVVHFHINPGTTVNFTNNDGEIQRISGPATVRMVSTNSSPPIPLPVQMPPGHVVQQIVDETGTLQHVIISAQPMPMPVCSYGPNAGQGPQFYNAPPPGPPPPQGYMTSYQATPQYPPVMSPPLTQPSPPPPPHNYQKNDRNSRQHEKIRHKFYQRHQQPPLHPHHYQLQQHQQLHLKMHSTNPIHNTPPLSPKKETVLVRKPDEDPINGEMSAESTQVQIKELLSTISPEVSGVGPYCADVHWTIPDLSCFPSEKGITESSLQFEVFLNGCSYDKVTAGSHLPLTNLRPGTEYKLYIVCFCNGIRAYQTPKQSFSTKPTVPDIPQPPRLVDRKKQSLLLKWNAPKENGAKILHYSLEMKGGHLNAWTEIYRNKNKEYLITKLRPQTSYRFRILANNEVGNSEYSPEIAATTVGLAPTQPNPPSLEQASVNSLKLSWQQRSTDESFSLEMDDTFNDYGFMPVFSGSEMSFTCHNLRRNSDYKFRLCSQNINGKSPYSEIACYRTKPDIPQPPSVPMMKGKHLSDRLCLTWSPPRDNGGTPVSNYLLQIDKGNGFETIYYGPVLECEVTSLSPGTTYRFRCCAESAGGKSKFSAEALLTTKPVVPGQCKPPRMLGKPKAHTLQLKWGYPDYDGGASVTEFQMDMITPDTERRQVYCGRDLECTVASLLPGRAYMFLLRASNRIGPGPWSEPYEVVSGAGPPDSPKPPHLACKGSHVVVVSWEEPINNGASVEQYVVNMAEVTCPNTESSESSSTCGDMESELSFATTYTGSATQAEVRNLTPATTYAFKVCASNVAGVGPFSSSASVTTPAAPPASVAHITSTPEATEVTLYWTEPACHGDSISHYNIEVGERIISTSGPVLEFTLNQLLPETLYKFRIQAVNSVGPSPFSGVHKVTTQPLPPPPPRIELVKASFNSLRLKWGEGRNPELLKYCLQMECYNPHTRISEFYQIYSGTNHSFKVGKLEENSTYRLRICASNEAGLGPFSEPLEFTTTKAPPPPLKAPRISEKADKSYCIEWCGVRCPGEDHIIYRLQVLQSGKDQDYSIVYVGSETSYILKDLQPQTGYYVRVCGVRMCGEKEVVAGAYSSPTLFNTPKIEQVEAPAGPTCSAKKQTLQWHLLSDHQKALAILSLFSLLAFVAAYVLSPSPET